MEWMQGMQSNIFYHDHHQVTRPSLCPVFDHDYHETLPALENGGNPFNMLSGMGGNMSQQLAGLMGMQGMGMPSMVSSHLFAVKQTQHLLVAGRHGRGDADEQLPALQHVGWNGGQVDAHGRQGDDGGGLTVIFDGVLHHAPYTWSNVGFSS